MDELRRDRRGDAVAHRAAARTDLRAVLGELGEPVRPDGEVARAAGLDRVAGQPPAQERHDLAEVDRPFHRLVPEIRLVVRARRLRPLPPARLDRLQLPQRGRELGHAAGDRQVRLGRRSRARPDRGGRGRASAAAAAPRGACSGASAPRRAGRRARARDRPRGAASPAGRPWRRRGRRRTSASGCRRSPGSGRRRRPAARSPRRRRARPRPSRCVQPPSPTITSGRSAAASSSRRRARSSSLGDDAGEAERAPRPRPPPPRRARPRAARARPARAAPRARARRRAPGARACDRRDRRATRPWRCRRTTRA